jgi:fumarate hydratase subunit alpha
MRTVDTSSVAEAVKGLFVQTATRLPELVLDDLARAFLEEPSPQGREVLRSLLENASIAESEKIPLCQDTGLPQIILEVGEEVLFSGPSLLAEAERGAREAYCESYLRRSGADPLTRENLGDLIPVAIELLRVPGDKVTVLTLAKGGGCDNKSSLFNLPPTIGPEGVKAAVLERIALAGPDSCPPYYVGICIGGTFESAPRYAKRALLDICLGEGQDPRELKLSEEYLESLNRTGIGPMALGGRHTALGLRVIIRPCHIASLPVAINLCCHSFRPGRAVI